MKILLKISIILCLLFIGIGTLSAQTERRQRENRPLQDNIIKGSVIDSLTNQPLIGASVNWLYLTYWAKTGALADQFQM